MMPLPCRQRPDLSFVLPARERCSLMRRAWRFCPLSAGQRAQATVRPDLEAGHREEGPSPRPSIHQALPGKIYRRRLAKTLVGRRSRFGIAYPPKMPLTSPSQDEPVLQGLGTWSQSCAN